LSRAALGVACPRCGAPIGERCVDLARYPLGWRGGVRGVLFSHKQRTASRRFVTLEGDRLHRLGQIELDGAFRSRCGLAVPAGDGHLVEPGDGLLERLVDCGNCARSLGSAS
jgi:hypothetical protein